MCEQKPQTKDYLSYSAALLCGSQTEVQRQQFREHSTLSWSPISASLPSVDLYILSTSVPLDGEKVEVGVILIALGLRVVLPCLWLVLHLTSSLLTWLIYLIGSSQQRGSPLDIFDQVDIFFYVRVPNLIALLKIGRNDQLVNTSDNFHSDVAEAFFR